jgi:hypothetical protein
MSESSDLFRTLIALLNQEAEQEEPAEQGEPVASRFKQILAMLDTPNDSPLANTPNEVVAPVSAVTTDAGGGVNGPKDPKDIRVKDPGGYE